MNDNRNNWIIGLILILVGSGFLLTNLGIVDFRFDNWWALFILIPAVVSFANAWRAYSASGRVDGAVAGSLAGGMITLTVALIFLFNLDWGVVWPIFLILGGLAVLMRYVAGDDAGGGEAQPPDTP